MALFAGLMSGTSLDGVDAVLAAWSDASTRPIELAFVHCPMPSTLRAELLALNSPGENELHRAACAANALAELYAQAVAELLRLASVGPADVHALGAHGQTVRHRPREFGGSGYTVQLLDAALLAERCGIDVVCDFRSRDVAAGGQGAPLVPAFHAEVFSGGGAAGAIDDIAVLNLGGIANLTLLPATGPVLGFDCGPGNMLMDLWCQRRRGLPYDADGRFAASGLALPALVQRCLADPFFDRMPPKSTGRDLFDARWLDAHLEAYAASAPQDVMASLAEVTAVAACKALKRHAPHTRQVLVCGGGAYNAHLMGRLRALLEQDKVAVSSTATVGMAPERVEALAFAWLARAFCERRPGNLSEVTGAAGPRVLGALYPV